MSEPKVLIDLGERTILREIIPKYVNGAGDDCAILPIGSGYLVATTDPVPPPAAASLGKDEDPFWLGWLLVTINASDLAASGASPLAFLAALDCPSGLPVANFERLLEGIRSACDAAGLAYVGGNIREAEKFSGVGFAMGWCEDYKPLRRSGADVHDTIVSIGAGGRFWRDALRVRAGHSVDKDGSPLFRPMSQIGVVSVMAKAGLITSAMDNSDGLLPTLSELSTRNQLGVELDIDALRVDGVEGSDAVGAARMWLGWGDWNVIASVSSSAVSEVTKIGKDHNVDVIPIARFLPGPDEVYLRRSDHRIVAPRLESERFSKDSWMTSGIDGYVNLLEKIELP